MSINHSIVVIIAFAMLSACSSTKNRVDYAAKAVSAPTLEVPPDLTMPQATDRYSIPGRDEKVASFSDFAKGNDNQKTAALVLPESRSVRIERSGTQHWLVVNDTAEKLWPKIKAFWFETGFALTLDDPKAGVMQTDWQENVADGEKSGMGKLFSGGWSSSGKRDQFLTRLERDKDSKSTEIYISHHGVQEPELKPKEGHKWEPRASDPELENAILQLLAAKLQGNDDTASKVNITSAPPAPVSAAVAVVAPQWKESSNSKTIILNEAFDKAWRQIGLALDRARLKVEDKDRSKGIFYLRVPAKDSKDLVSYQLQVKETAGVSEISATNANVASDAGSQRVLETVFQQINK